MPLTLGTNDRLLRSRLAEITQPADASELKAQIQQMTNLALTQPHSVSLLEENIPVSRRFNCYQYSFGIADIRVQRGILEVFPGRDFAQFLVDHLLEEVGAQDTDDGSHVLYSGSQIEHAGKVQAGAVVSKWGTGHIWQHGVYEVPDYYGDTVRFFRPFPREMALQALLEFYPGARIE
jgi:hypothetical protein